VWVWFRDLKHARIEQSVATHQTAVGDVELAGSLDDEEEVVVTGRNHAVRGPLGNDHVVALLERQRAVIRFDRSLSTMHEVTDVAVRVP
jgi:hypothetical protein